MRRADLQHVYIVSELNSSFIMFCEVVLVVTFLNFISDLGIVKEHAL